MAQRLRESDAEWTRRVTAAERTSGVTQEAAQRMEQEREIINKDFAAAQERWRLERSELHSRLAESVAQRERCELAHRSEFERVSSVLSSLESDLHELQGYRRKCSGSVCCCVLAWLWSASASHEILHCESLCDAAYLDMEALLASKTAEHTQMAQSLTLALNNVDTLSARLTTERSRVEQLTAQLHSAQMMEHAAVAQQREQLKQLEQSLQQARRDANQTQTECQKAQHELDQLRDEYVKYAADAEEDKQRLTGEL